MTTFSAIPVHLHCSKIKRRLKAHIRSWWTNYSSWKSSLTSTLWLVGKRNDLIAFIRNKNQKQKRETKISNLLRTRLKITPKMKFNWNTGLPTGLANLQHIIWLSLVHEPLQACKYSWQCLFPTPGSGHQGLLESLWPCLAVDALIQYLRFHWCSTGFSSGNVFITAYSLWPHEAGDYPGPAKIQDPPHKQSLKEIPPST